MTNLTPEQMINTITPSHSNYDKSMALLLANKWNQTDEKWMMIMDTFELNNDTPRIEQWVDFIELTFEKILEANKTDLDQNAQSWMWLCDE